MLWQLHEKPFIHQGVMVMNDLRWVSIDKHCNRLQYHQQNSYLNCVDNKTENYSRMKISKSYIYKCGWISQIFFQRKEHGRKTYITCYQKSFGSLLIMYKLWSKEYTLTNCKLVNSWGNQERERKMNVYRRNFNFFLIFCFLKT